MNFSSDNAAGVSPEIMAALDAANRGPANAYGADEISRRLDGLFATLFEREVAVFPVATGTAANALALACLTPPWGVVYCHAEAHVEVDECGAPEFYSGGAKLCLLPGADAKLDADALEAALAAAPKGVEHHAQPAAVTITQASEAGAVWRPEEIARIAGIARRHGVALHMDGARFANAAAALGLSPAALTWRAGVDALSFGATKNGAMAAEAVLFFDPARAAEFRYRRKRAGHLFSKMRFLSAQLEAYLKDGLWLRNAAHANACARRLADGLAGLPGARLVHPCEANEAFVALPEAVIARLKKAGAGFHRWGGAASPVVRFVCAFDTPAADVDRLLALAASA